MENEMQSVKTEKNNELGVFYGDQVALTGKVPATVAEKIALANAMSQPTHKLSEYVNMQISLTNFYVDPQRIVYQDTGEVRNSLKVVLIDQFGKSYVTLSTGVANALKSIIQVFGLPDSWEAPLLVDVKQVQVGKGKLLTLAVNSYGKEDIGSDT